MADLQNAYSTCCINDRYSKKLNSIEEPNRQFEVKKGLELNDCSFDSSTRGIISYVNSNLIKDKIK